MKLVRLNLILLGSFLWAANSFGAATEVKIKKNPQSLMALRTAKGRVAVFKEYFEKTGVDYTLKNEKICELPVEISVYDLTAGPNPDFKPAWFEVCQVVLNGYAGSVAVSSDIVISNIDLFLDGVPKTYRNFYANVGFGPMGGPYLINGTNTTFEQDLSLGRKLTLKVLGVAPASNPEKLHIALEVED